MEKEDVYLSILFQNGQIVRSKDSQLKNDHSGQKTTVWQQFGRLPVPNFWENLLEFITRVYFFYVNT